VVGNDGAALIWDEQLGAFLAYYIRCVTSAAAASAQAFAWRTGPQGRNSPTFQTLPQVFHSRHLLGYDRGNVWVFLGFWQHSSGSALTAHGATAHALGTLAWVFHGQANTPALGAHRADVAAAGTAARAGG
jgi:hypothetical protein